MKQKIKELFIKYRELISYVFFGGLTTLVNWGVYFIFNDVVNIHYQAAQWIAWVAAVIFAFVVNKRYVFNDNDMTKQGLARQTLEFFGVRLISNGVESLLLALMVETMHMSSNISKIIVSVITVILNYFASKLWIFRKKNVNNKAK
ncbi:MAG: GtrA family protein [Clostridiales bacterium]|nr:GtrA family protein [Clostridiales bacterium]